MRPLYTSLMDAPQKIYLGKFENHPIKSSFQAKEKFSKSVKKCKQETKLLLWPQSLL